MSSNRTVEFFDAQFQRQVAAHEFALNPFEQWALPHLAGRVLDLGCGLGNLSLTAARRGCEVLAVDASPSAIDHLQRTALAEGLSLTPVLAKAEEFAIPGSFDAVVAIGLFMFFRCDEARTLLGRVLAAVRAGGHAVVNVLVEGTTYTEMFDGDRYCLFAPDELERAFDGWTVVLARRDDFPAPRGTVKRFSTVVARKPG